MSTIPPPRAVVTSHTASGTAIIPSDSQLPLFHPFGPLASGFTTIHTLPSLPSLPSLPASLIAPINPNSEPSIPRPSPAGLVVCTTDFPPHYVTPTHRTITCDYMIVIKGEIVLRVDEGKETILKEGDMCVQRVTMHTWENRTEEWCRCVCVMAGGEKIVMADGKVLEQSYTAPKPKN
ncbi:uncharacterized protein EAF01_000945 [Botrytis porri]|uniref:uncharacterized protein n=1 Tax=Botrytis porri TaxID=87229 RepID=UPI0018FFEEB9|nr:uncharacterized protein EAF01_000945 [Botrytis porri]KAF7914539.1 hypothetical protein EAF01_000945 [Botrytis porri]